MALVTMNRALPAPLLLPPAFWWLWLPLNLAVVPVAVGAIAGVDWVVWSEAVRRIADGRLYAVDASYYYVFSPVMAWLLVPIVQAGIGLQIALHFAALALLRDWRLALLIGVSFAFWTDATAPNFLIFSVVAGVLALRGSSLAAIAYVALFLLMPRPVELPMAVWLLWQRPSLRPHFLAVGAVVAALTLASGYAFDWLAVLRSVGMQYPHDQWNISPTRLVGSAWLLVGVPLAAWLTWKGRVGLAGVVLAPYLVPRYLMVLAWELVRERDLVGLEDALQDDLVANRPRDRDARRRMASAGGVGHDD